MNFFSTNSILAVSKYALSLSLITGCNSRPTFDIVVLEFQSDCVNAAVVRVEHDPEPEVRSFKIEPGFEAAAEQAKTHFAEDGERITVEFGSDSVCYHPLGGGLGTCRSKSLKQPLSCSACLKRIAYRWPSKGPGFGGPLGKEGEDTPVPIAGAMNDSP
jgi:hypothetical protein